MFDVFTSFHLAGIGKASMYLFSLLKASIAVDSNVISIMLTYENQTEHLSIKFPIDELSQSILILEYSQD